MRVIWSFCKPLDGRECTITKPLDELLLVASVQSWTHYAPEYERVFYVDQFMYDWLASKRYLSYWHTVKVIDFKKEVTQILGSTFYAYPKIWTMTRQVEPFWICDTDVVLRDRPSSVISDSVSVLGQVYDIVSVPEILKGGREGSLLASSNFHKLKQTGLDMLGKGLNGGLVYYPDPKVASILAYSIFGAAPVINSAVGCSSVSWFFFEEVILYSFLTYLGIPIKDIKIHDHFSVDLREAVNLSTIRDLLWDISHNPGVDLSNHQNLLSKVSPKLDKKAPLV